MILGCTLALIPTVTLAQFASSDNRDPFNRAATGDTSGLMQLLNKAQMSGSRNESEYYRGQDEQINSATEDFRARQIQALRQKSKQAAAKSAVPVEPSK
jgi:hypothetical protein